MCSSRFNINIFTNYDNTQVLRQKKDHTFTLTLNLNLTSNLKLKCSYLKIMTNGFINFI